LKRLRVVRQVKISGGLESSRCGRWSPGGTSESGAADRFDERTGRRASAAFPPARGRSLKSIRRAIENQRTRGTASSGHQTRPTYPYPAKGGRSDRHDRSLTDTTFLVCGKHLRAGPFVATNHLVIVIEVDDKKYEQCETLPSETLLEQEPTSCRWDVQTAGRWADHLGAVFFAERRQICGVQKRASSHLLFFDLMKPAGLDCCRNIN